MVSTWSSPNPILYGSGASDAVGAQLKRLGCSKVMVVYDMGIQAVAEKIIAQIAKEGVEYLVYNKVESDAPDYTVNEAAAIARAEGVDGIVAIGGGSAIDTGKGICVLLTNEPPISQYYIKPGLPPTVDITKLKPIVVIPTTAGTGTEVTPGGCIADTEHNTKEDTCCPTALGIIDPLVTLGLPRNATIATGMDAMCHAIEAYISNEPNAFSDILAKEAITRVAANLPIVAKDGQNIPAREEMHLAATLGAMSILGPFCNIGHDTGKVLGIDFHMPHGYAVSCCLPEIMRFIAPARPEKTRVLLECLGAEVPADDAALGQAIYDAFVAFMAKVDYPAISVFIPSKEAMLGSVRKVMETQNFHFSPVPVSEEDVTAIFSAAWDRSCGK